MIITLIHALFNRETEFFAYIFFLIFSNISAAFVLLFRQNSAVQNICSEVQVTCKKQPRDIRQHQSTRNFIKFEKPACHYNHGDEQHHKQNERRKAKIQREKKRRPEHIQNELNEVNAERTRRLPADIRRLRGKMKEDERQDKIITTVWGVGYKIEK